MASRVDAEVVADIKARSRIWDIDGLALEDQLMASYGAALEIVGKFEKVINPDGSSVQLEHYMTLSRKAVRNAVALRLGEFPLESFDPATRLAIFWNELYGTSEVPKGEARFFAQSDDLRLEDLRGRVITESKGGYTLRHDGAGQVTPESSLYEVACSMAAAWQEGTDAVARVVAWADVSPTDSQLWAIIDWLSTRLPGSDPIRVGLAGVKRNRSAVQASVQKVDRESLDRDSGQSQGSLF
jgi:adenine-specific DNA methylase